jgi:large subunit ribosomal protein L9
MKVILTQNVDRLGQAGEVKDVATGYARNYLIPKGLALAATPGTLKQWNAQQKTRAIQEERLAEQASELIERLSTQVLTFEAKAGPTGRLYGSVTTGDIAEALEREFGISVDRRKILSDPLREVGEHTISVRLASEAVAEVRAVVRAEGAEEGLEAAEGVEPEGEDEAEGSDDLADDSIPQMDEPEAVAEE